MMAKSGVAQGGAPAGAAIVPAAEGGRGPRRLRSRVARYAARYAAAASTAWLVLAVAAQAKMENIFMKPEASQFKAAPKPPGAEEEEAAAASIDYILGVHVNTIFFVAAAVIGVLWFWRGGGRKAKVTRH